MIITGATGTSGHAAVTYFAKEYDLILLDLYQHKLKHTQNVYAPEAKIMKFDIRKTVDLVRLVALLKDRGGFDYLLHFASFGPFSDDLAEIYKVNLIGTKKLFDYLYPHILPGGIIFNISASPFLLVEIPEHILPLLHDPLRRTFLEEILPHTKSSQEAYSFSKYGCAQLCSHHELKWQLKNGRVISIFPNLKHVHSSAEAAQITLFRQDEETFFIDLATLCKSIHGLINTPYPAYSGQNITLDQEGNVHILKINLVN